MNDYQRDYWRRRKQEEFKPAHDALMKVYPFTLENLPNESWKEFADYQISNFGRVKSFKGKQPRILRPSVTHHGYLSVMLCMNGEKKKVSVHQLVAQLFIPNPLNKPQVNHIDGIKFNCHVSNLEWCTRSENVQHAFDTGLSPSEQYRREAKLTVEQVLYVRENPDGLNACQLAQMFGVNMNAIGRIQRGKRWKHVGGSLRQTRPQKYTPPVPDEVRAQIRAEYVYRSKEFGSVALAKKYGCTAKAIWNIVHEN